MGCPLFFLSSPYIISQLKFVATQLIVGCFANIWFRIKKEKYGQPDMGLKKGSLWIKRAIRRGRCKPGRPYPGRSLPDRR